MIYYRVNPEYDNTTYTRTDKRTGRRMYHGFLIGNELYTEKELENMRKDGVNDLWERKFEKVEIKKSRVYWSFGARFEMKE